MAKKVVEEEEEEDEREIKIEASIIDRSGLGELYSFYFAWAGSSSCCCRVRKRTGQADIERARGKDLVLLFLPLDCIY